MAKKHASPARASAGKPDDPRRVKGVSKENAERRHTSKSDPDAQIAALSPVNVVEWVGDPSERETSFITEADKREVQHGAVLMEESQAPLRLDVGAMSLVDLGFGRQDGEKVPQRWMRVLFDFQLSGELAQQLAGVGLPYFVQLMAWDLASGLATVLATDQSRLTAGQVTYPAALQFPMLKLGRYQLVGLVLLPDKDKVGVTLGDVLNVVP